MYVRIYCKRNLDNIPVRSFWKYLIVRVGDQQKQWMIYAESNWKKTTQSKQILWCLIFLDQGRRKHKFLIVSTEKC